MNLELHAHGTKKSQSKGSRNPILSQRIVYSPPFSQPRLSYTSNLQLAPAGPAPAAGAAPPAVGCVLRPPLVEVVSLRIFQEHESTYMNERLAMLISSIKAQLGTVAKIQRTYPTG